MLPVIIYFFLNSDIEAIIDDLIFIPMDTIMQQTFPYPALSKWNLPFYVFPSVLLVGIVTFFILIKCKMDNTVAYGILLISLVGIVFLNQVWARSDTAHLLPVALTAILLSPILFYTLSRMLSLRPWLYGLFFVLFIIFFGITLSKPINKKYRLLPGSYTIEIVNPDIERTRYTMLNFPDIKKSSAIYKEEHLKR